MLKTYFKITQKKGVSENLHSSCEILFKIFIWCRKNFKWSSPRPGRGGGTQVWFSLGRAATKFESRPIQTPIFQEKVTHSYTNRPNFAPNFEQNRLIFPKFS